MFETILVPTDGSDAAWEAVEHAFAIADRYGATVHFLHCVETHRYGEPALSSAEIVIDNLEDRGGSLLADLEGEAADRGLESSSSLCHGRPWEEVRAVAADRGVDLIVIGSRGRGGRTAGRIGSVAERIVRTVERPVLTV